MAPMDPREAPGTAETWPPSPAVWPPQPTTPTFAVPFKYLTLRAGGKELRRVSLSDSREGVLELGPEGMRIRGKAVMRAEVRLPIFIVALVIARLFGLLAYLAMEYGFRRDETHLVPWDAVRLMQFAPQKQQACVVYDAPNKKGTIKRFSLAFKVDPGISPSLSEYARQFCPGAYAEGNLRRLISFRVWLRLILLLVAIIAAVIAGVSHH